MVKLMIKSIVKTGPFTQTGASGRAIERSPTRSSGSRRPLKFSQCWGHSGCSALGRTEFVQSD